MLALKEIKKEYTAGDSVVEALRGVSIAFRKNEFVSILGPSGCGKTTLLNIIGGLDRYTTGDLIIGGRSTKSFSDHDWDTYRNHSIGFVFQSYNLIPHQTVLTNVELALTISGVSKAERRRRATEALQKVGLGDQLDKKPNQMSGGQMQRVAIARAIVNDPEILLADEPTGALDSVTSLQIMEILREIASDRLVIMVTHNPELAETYSTRIVRLQDGVLLSDSDPYSHEEATAEVKKDTKKKKPLSHMTALSLSLNNLMTKKARTFLTSFAGSIGIIGIALILSLSTGINAYISDVQEDALSSYPITLMHETQDYSAMFSAMVDAEADASRPIKDGVIYVDDSLVNMMSAMMSTTQNDLTSFKAHLESHMDELKDIITDVSYTYNFNMQIYSGDGATRINPTTIVDNMGDSVSGMIDMMSSANSMYASTYSSTMNIFREMLDDKALVQSQYDVVAGEWTDDPHEVMLVINENNTVTNLLLYVLGMEDQSELADLVTAVLSGKPFDKEYKDYSYEDFLGQTFYIVPNSDFYVKTGETYEKDGKTYPVWEDVRTRKDFDQESFAKEHGVAITVSALIRPNPDAVSTSLIPGSVAYDGALAEEIMEIVRDSEIAKQQTEQTPDFDVLSGLPFDDGRYDDLTDKQKIMLFTDWIAGETKQKADIMLELLAASSVEELAKTQVATMSAEQKAAYAAEHFYDLADIDPELFKTLVLAYMEQSMGSEYAQYKDYFLAMDAASFAEMIKQSGQMSPDALDEQSVAALTQVFLAMPDTEMTSLVEALVALSLSENAVDELLAAYTTAELAAMFDETYENMTDGQKLMLYTEYMPALVSDTVYDKRTVDLGFVDPESPATISIYVKDFASKDVVTEFIASYNETVDEHKQIDYTDLIGIMLSSVTAIINAISYVLIAFVSISLVVSSIMIGIITYISVLERTKEIGILRAIGASKRDISRVFNAETLIVGFCAGAIGIVSTVLLCFPINAIIHYYSGIEAINAFLPAAGGVFLMAVSMLLTFVAGLFPSRIAAKKDPVKALRTE